MYARDYPATAAPVQETAAHNGHGAATEDVFDAAVAALRLLGDETRLRLLWHLRDEEWDVTALTAALGTAARPAVSQHLAKLRLAGLVATRRDGRRVLYRLNGAHVRRLVLESLAQAEHLIASGQAARARR
ncbi:ArsR/SmtB family transcription factor [Catenuloplanes atrovinosus]|uniref:DNA-binding transcriptional ArsR family regulator n=1 Tax=Catenuloplanes atrovinosus TaxID=137266 RepID=A0AAE4CAM2_9ACTN|nr:metalloregulator ArsR/SmtB family transcription factor [Catenuloplanes atrovinosus]MDR7274740.1 DNA-binding transcriptional ArsR family regulator [Catenuloplanes atrovinosus]